MLQKGEMMEAFAILGFVFGLIAFVRIEKLTRTLKKREFWKRITRRSKSLFQNT